MTRIGQEGIIVRRFRQRDRPSQQPVALSLGPASVEEVPLELLDQDDSTFQYRLRPRPELLVKSVRENGIQVPLIVRPHPLRPGRFQLMCGFQRARAASLAGLATVPVLVRRLSDEQAGVLAFIENEQRRTLTDLDRAQAILKLRKTGKTLEEVSTLFGLSRRQVQNLQALLDFPEELRGAVEDASSGVTTTHALTLMEARRRHGGAVRLSDWIQFIREEKCSVSELRRSIRDEVPDGRCCGSLMRRTEQRVTIDLGAISWASDAQRGAAIKELERLIEELR